MKIKIYSWIYSWFCNINILELFAFSLDLQQWLYRFNSSVFLNMLEVGAEIYFSPILIEGWLGLSPHSRCKWFVVLFYFWPFKNFLYLLHLLGFFPQTCYHLNTFRLSCRLQFNWFSCLFIFWSFLSWLFEWILSIIFVVEIIPELFYRVQNLFM